MIRINLLGEKVDRRGIYLLMGLAYFSTLSLMAVACFVFHKSQLGLLDRDNQKVARLEARLELLKEATGKVDGLEAREKMLREKLMTISRLKADKQKAVHILDEIAKAVPKRAWLKSLSQREQGLSIGGLALDNKTISDFMNNINRSPYFKNADLVYSQQDEWEGVKVNKFKLSAHINSPLSVKRSLEESAQSSEGVTAANEKIYGSAGMTAKLSGEPADSISPADPTASSVGRVGRVGGVEEVPE